MKALQLQSLGQVRLIETDPPPINPDELLVRTGAATICTSDLADIRENPFGIQMPVILGHEGAGIVAAVGSHVGGFHVGDRVATHPVHPCGQCVNCARGLGHLCMAMGHFGINRPGVFAEYYPVRADRARLVATHLPYHQAALAEPVSVCLEALSQASLQPGGRLLILGDGPFGVLIARLAQRLPLKSCVIAGWIDFRLGFAGQALQVNTRGLDDPFTRLLAEADGMGFDSTILAVSSVDALSLGLRLLRPKGRLVVFSAMPKETTVNLFDLHVRELEIVGACNDQDRFDQAVATLSDPEVDLGGLVTHFFPLEGFQEALDLAANGKERALKIAFRFEVE